MRIAKVTGYVLILIGLIYFADATVDERRGVAGAQPPVGHAFHHHIVTREDAPDDFHATV